MENNCRILNRIVEINISNVKYADIELSGNTCFVGTNNFGKTSLQRAILFFYSANSRGLGISASQKPFEEHYFRYENSYLIYEIATEDKSFFVMVYRHNKIVFRFFPFQRRCMVPFPNVLILLTKLVLHRTDLLHPKLQDSLLE